MTKAKLIFLKCFMIIRLKHFHESLNIVVILVPTNCVQFPLTFTE